ncbi:hypothetical protein [Streptomyces sp. NBC_00151]|uniref:hypothetical protein n=1 Tax=Streptomyces sp. NBC_00151 TaxID=2975669 RepID=UPI002DD84E8C|nr:hypothetical protein [Streptomyces sp. NBC_00151]WRZ39944.1 hypothetical protein OG915_18990 [Streptomyces sp. NBC_00151]
MKTALRAGVAAMALLGLMTVTPAASAVGPGVNAEVETVQFAGGQSEGLVMAENAPAGTKEILESNTVAAAAAANVCGSGYTTSTGAARYGTYGTTYTWWNGTYSGSNHLYDRPICAVFFNDSSYTRYMGVRLEDNYTATADTEDFGAYSQYAGPVYQNKGYCGQAYSYMEEPSGKVVVDNLLAVGTCD